MYPLSLSNKVVQVKVRNWMVLAAMLDMQCSVHYAWATEFQVCMLPEHARVASV